MGVYLENYWPFKLILCLFLFGIYEVEAKPVGQFSACFNQAETYYEQIYCEIKAQGEGGSLPAFIDFKKNNEQMQALLLKRKAQALSIPFKMPTKKRELSQRTMTPDHEVQQIPVSNCQYLERSIQCHDGNFSIVGNKRNSSIQQNALADDNKMALDSFAGDINNNTQVLTYLTKSYTRYIEKMLEIGLGGSTMSFTKFYYLFQDLNRQGVDFQKRFETMFGYLKLDKRSLGVTEQIESIQGLSMSHCNRLKVNLFTCDNGKNNRVYIR